MIDLSKSSIDFLKGKYVAFITSIILILLSIGLFFLNGLNFGIDFKGGTLIEIETQNKIEISEVRSSLNSLSLGDIQVQEFGSDKNLLIRIEQQQGGDQIQQNVLEIVKQKLMNDIVRQLILEELRLLALK